MMRFTGHDATDPVDIFATANDADNNPLSPGVTTTVDGALILRLGAFDDRDITVEIGRAHV